MGTHSNRFGLRDTLCRQDHFTGVMKKVYFTLDLIKEEWFVSKLVTII